MTATITGTGSALPGRTVTNRELETFLNTSDEWIRERTGICERRIVGEETVTGLAALAASRALEDAGTDAASLDLILAATSSADHVYPCLACEIAGKLKAGNAAAFDLNAACSGFLFALNSAWAYIRAGLAKKVLVVGAEAMSRMTDWTDRGTCILFGDGAGAAVVEACETGGILKSAARADGEKGMVLSCVNRAAQPGFAGTAENSGIGTLQMDGRAVYQFAVETVPKLIGELLTEEEKSAVDYYLLHQANERIIRSIARRLKEPIEKFPMNVQRMGNLSAASVPVLLDEVSRAGTLKPGSRIVLAGFGAGLTYGAIYMEWTKQMR